MGFLEFLKFKKSANTAADNTAKSTPVPPPAAAPVTPPVSNPDQITVYDSKGVPVVLAKDNIIASGGEGTVYTLPGNDNLLIKLYKPSLLKDQEKFNRYLKRFFAMLKLGNKIHSGRSGAKNSFAWPVIPICDNRKQMIGFGMYKCKGVSFRTLGSIASIKRNFPEWTRRELTLTALDFVRKLQFLQSNGVQINDFNPSNFLVDADCNVSFIDCDSFQITDQNDVHITRTYFASHCAPELLKNKQLLALPRNTHHLEFGAAITIFNLLMCGLHPYAYHDPFQRTVCGNPEENLLNGRCPLGVGAGCKFPNGNWYNLWNWIPHNAKGGFISTFRNGHSNPELRTSLADWEKHLLEMLDLMAKYPERMDIFPQAPNPKAVARKSSRASDIFSKKSNFAPANPALPFL